MEVQLTGIRFERDRRRVLDIPSLRLRSGVTTAILGPNGSGKTTMLRLIAGLDRPQAGEVRVGGAPLQPRQDLAYVFQEQVFLRRSVRANLELGLHLRGVNASERRARIDEALRRLGIPHLVDRRADRLSGGEGRRVSLARALCLRAPLVLFDEPLEGLDQRTHSRLLDELPQLLAAFDATTVLVTHNRDEALRLADDLVVIVDGRVLAAGDKREVATNPRVPEVAEVLGYTVLVSDAGTIAAPPNALRPGPGPVQFTLDVDGVADLIDCREVIGRIGDVRVRVSLGAGCHVPVPGTTLTVHAVTSVDLGTVR